MNKKPDILYLSFLPVFILVGLIFGTGYFLLKDDIKLPGTNKEPEVRRLESFPAVIFLEETIDKQRTVIRSEEELQTFLKLVDPFGTMTISESINFDKEFLVGVATKTETETGNTIKIRKVYENKEDKTLTISVKQTEIPDECERTAESNIAVDLVVISKTDHEIDFDTTKEKSAKCN